MPLCGVTKQWNSMICCNILTETSVKTHFHKRSGELHLLKAEQDFSESNEGGAPSSAQSLFGIYFHAKACFCSPAERRYYHPSFSKLLHTWQFIFCMISQKSIRSCKDKYQIAMANWCSLGWTPLIMLSWGSGDEVWVYPASLHALIKSPDDLWMNSQLVVPSLPMVLQGLGAQVCIKRVGEKYMLLRWGFCSVKSARNSMSCDGMMQSFQNQTWSVLSLPCMCLLV